MTSAFWRDFGDMLACFPSSLSAQIQCFCFVCMSA